MTSEKSQTRLKCSAAVKAQVVSQCDDPGASVAKVSMSHGANRRANRMRALVHVGIAGVDQLLRGVITDKRCPP